MKTFFDEVAVFGVSVNQYFFGNSQRVSIFDELVTLVGYSGTQTKKGGRRGMTQQVGQTAPRKGIWSSNATQRERCGKRPRERRRQRHTKEEGENRTTQWRERHTAQGQG